MFRRQFLGFLAPLAGLLLGRRALAAPAPARVRGKVVGVLQVIFPQGNDHDWRANVAADWQGVPYLYVDPVPANWLVENYGAFMRPTSTLALVRLDEKGRVNLDPVRTVDEAWQNLQKEGQVLS